MDVLVAPVPLKFTSKRPDEYIDCNCFIITLDGGQAAQRGTLVFRRISFTLIYNSSCEDIGTAVYVSFDSFIISEKTLGGN